MNRRQLLTRALGAVASLSLYGPAAVALKPTARPRALSIPRGPVTRTSTVFIDEAEPGADVQLNRLICLLDECSQPDWFAAERDLSRAYFQWSAGRPERQL